MKINQQKKHLRLLAVIAALIIAGIFIVVLQGSDKNYNKGSEEGKVITLDLALAEEIKITELDSYTGKYFEDGSDENVSNVMALRIRNNGNWAVQLADFRIFDENENPYHFRVTTLLPGKEMIVLEQNRAAYQSDINIVTGNIENIALFKETPDLQEDVFEISCDDNLIKVKNISEKSVSAGRIFYKNISEGIYMGGITYMVSIPSLDPGAEVELSSRHYVKGTSEMVFATYAE